MNDNEDAISVIGGVLLRAHAAYRKTTDVSI